MKEIYPKYKFDFYQIRIFYAQMRSSVCLLRDAKKELTILLLRCSLDAGSDEVGSETHSALKIVNYCKNK